MLNVLSVLLVHVGMLPLYVNKYCITHLVQTHLFDWQGIFTLFAYLLKISFTWSIFANKVDDFFIYFQLEHHIYSCTFIKIIMYIYLFLINLLDKIYLSFTITKRSKNNYVYYNRHKIVLNLFKYSTIRNVLFRKMYAHDVK